MGLSDDAPLESNPIGDEEARRKNDIGEKREEDLQRGSVLSRHKSSSSTPCATFLPTYPSS
jgi:hypothetical protein